MTQNQTEFAIHQKKAEHEIVLSYAPGMTYPYLVYVLRLSDYKIINEDVAETPIGALNLVKEYSRDLLLKGCIV